MKSQETTNRAVFITGASRGIGKACATMLYGLGFRVFAGIHREEDATNFSSLDPDRFIPVLIDITDTASIKAAVNFISNKLNHSGLYGLVNNAGIAVAGPLEFIPLDRLREQFEINVFGHIAVTQECLPLLRKGMGRIINISSKEGIVAMPFVGPYCASKFALEALSDALRMELKQWNIPVSVIQPGTIATEIISRSIESAEECIRALPQYAINLYDFCFKRARTASLKIMNNAIPPETVARCVSKALKVKNPKPRYTVGKDAIALSVMRRLLPHSWLEKLILKELGL